ncbi:MAG: SRPBCC domain-containing protein [Acidimicrobiia bacterium]
MYAIKAQFEAGCSPSQLKDWLDNTNGIAGWWSDGVTGDAGSVGDQFHVKFPTSPVVFDLRVTEMRDEAVEWHIDENPPWWKDTTIRFDLSPAENGTRLLFTHTGFQPDDPIIAVITPAWVRFLDNLVKVGETGRANAAVRN